MNKKMKCAPYFFSICSQNTLFLTIRSHFIVSRQKLSFLMPLWHLARENKTLRWKWGILMNLGINE